MGKILTPHYTLQYTAWGKRQTRIWVDDPEVKTRTLKAAQKAAKRIQREGLYYDEGSKVRIFRVTREVVDLFK